MKIKDAANPRTVAGLRGALDYFAAEAELGEYLKISAHDYGPNGIGLDIGICTEFATAEDVILLEADIPRAARNAGAVAVQTALREVRGE